MSSTAFIFFSVRRVAIGLLCGMSLTWGFSVRAGEVAGAGATFPASIYKVWAEHYARLNTAKVSYAPTGSGDGIAQISERKVSFGGTDVPLSQDELDKRRLVQVPTVAGAVVPIYRLPSLKDKRLRLTGPVLASMFMGQISRWNDPQLQALNPGVALPDLPIRRIVRADKSGSTEAFAQYLADANPAFAQTVGVSKLPKWPGEFVAAEGSSGVVKAVQQTEGALSFTGLDRVAKDRLQAALLRNRDGAWADASEEGIRSAIQGSDVHRLGLDTASTLDMPGPNSWPITVVTFILFDRQPSAGEGTEAALKFFYWSFMQGDRLVKGTGFSALPIQLQARLASRLSSIRTASGDLLSPYSR